MEPTAVLQETLAVLFDENELRTLFSTDLYLGDLTHRLPPRGSGGVAAAMARGLAEERRVGRAFFRTLANLRPQDRAVVQRAEALWFARRVLLVHGEPCDPAREAQARHDARFARSLAEQLLAAGHRPLVCGLMGTEAPVSLTLAGALDDCEAFALVVSPALPEHQAVRALERIAARGTEGAQPMVLALATSAVQPGSGLAGALPEPAMGCADPEASRAAVAALLTRLTILAPLAGGVGSGPWPPPRTGQTTPPARPGPTPQGEARRRILGGEGAEITQEVLKRPIEIAVEGDRLRAVVDRSGVDTMVLGAEARKALWLQELGSRAGMARARAWDACFQAVLTGTPGPRPGEGCPPLRWGGAGAVVELTWRGRAWLPLFFRDIPPFGWNLPLGASGPGDDLDDPLGWGTRELLEELIVVQGDPAWGQTLPVRPLLVDGEPDAARARALAHARLPLALRERCDRLPAALGPGIPCDSRPTRTVLCLRQEGGELRIPDMLLAPTPLELGLDAARVLRADLCDDDSLLDGEVLTREDGRQELVRMPVALVAVEAVRRLFGPGATATVAEGTPPSIRTVGFLPGEVHIFPWDVRRRRDLAVGARISDGQIDPRERARHRAWLDQFGHFFLDSRGDPTNESPSPLFVGSTARLLTVWAHHVG